MIEQRQPLVRGSGILKERLVSGRHLLVGFGKIIIPLENNSNAACVCWKDENVGIRPEGVENSEF
jgi:hypothetical protein